jgi:hypothetical protein
MLKHVDFSSKMWYNGSNKSKHGGSIPMIENAEQLVDVKENALATLDPKILRILLKDKTTRQNIIWATDDYVGLGEQYASDQQITVSSITGENGNVIRPRIEKTKDEQTLRVRNKAEVFTPSWVCNKQNNLVDSSWFGRDNVFNVETENGWVATTEKIIFPESKTWQDYVKANRLEISCGEAPYLVSRYDTVTGEPIEVERRIGLLDRKLRVVCENCDFEQEWIGWAKRAVQSVYGYDWQGDNVLLARENLLYTYVDYYEYKFGKPVNPIQFTEIAKILAWNIWQMDGIKFVIPNSCTSDVQEQMNMFGEAEKTVIPCPGCSSGNHSLHNGLYARTYDWVGQHSVIFRAFIDPKFRRKK